MRASEFLRDPQVLAVLRDEIAKKLGSAAVIGINVLVDLALHSTSQQVKLGAARELVDRGFGPVMSRNASIVATTSIEDIIHRLDAQEKAKEAAGEFTNDDGAFIDITPAASHDDEGDGEE